ncbi:16S rRNA (cytosine(967)-C(5))-methyltransferase RsmB [Pseudaeromonas sharmana]|uniref:16S rRNA (cytosine(967)-C(5))-methyltransferase n=1 Tax=Pseudaeromonas sharmana TaxID=328412 RepID=A0ABV8CML9_9GAMM
MKTRAHAAQVIYQVVENGLSLSSLLPAAQDKIAIKDRALLQELCFGTLRWLSRLESIVAPLISKPLKGKQRPVHYLLLIGLYQLLYTRIPPHAALSETVNATRLLKSEGLKGMVNGVLRNAQRQSEQLQLQAEHTETSRYAHPGWFIRRIKEAYPADYQQILEANNQRPPMWIRVNTRHQDRQTYLTRLANADIHVALVDPAGAGICLQQACDVSRLPGFSDGDCSVQDGAAQLSASLLQPQPGDWVLDACAAPGGKTAHLMELQSELAGIVAVDADATRLQRVHENLHRLGLTATVLHGDASQPDTWWQGPQFDRILLDAPCSATGVIRRHPDIKWLRRDSDIAELVALQAKILDALWHKLKPNGTLLYATCSILPDENREQIRAFLLRTPDAKLVALHDMDTPAHPGWQRLPGEDNMDGFYYAKLTKQAVMPS